MHNCALQEFRPIYDRNSKLHEELDNGNSAVATMLPRGATDNPACARAESICPFSLLPLGLLVDSTGESYRTSASNDEWVFTPL